MAPLRGEKNFKPRPQERVLVPLRGSFQHFNEDDGMKPCRLVLCSLAVLSNLIALKKVLCKSNLLDVYMRSMQMIPEVTLQYQWQTESCK